MVSTGPQSLGFCPTLEALYRTGESVGRTRSRVSAGGLSTVNNLIAIERLFDALRPERTLEIGLAHGGSALTFAAAHQRAGHDRRERHTAIDPFQRDWSDEVGLCNLERAGLRDFVRWIDNPSAIAMPKLREAGETFQMIYVDGSHDFPDVFVDIYNSRRLLAVGGLMLMDDSRYPGVRKVLRHIRQNLRKEFEPVPSREYAEFDLRRSIAHRIGYSQLSVFRKIDVTPEW